MNVVSCNVVVLAVPVAVWFFDSSTGPCYAIRNRVSFRGLAVRVSTDITQRGRC